MILYFFFLFVSAAYCKPVDPQSAALRVVAISENFDDGVGSSFTTNSNITLFQGFWNWQPESDNTVGPVRIGVLRGGKRSSVTVGEAHLHSVETFSLSSLSYVTFEVDGYVVGTPELVASYVDSTGYDHAGVGFEENIVLPLQGEWTRTKAKVPALNLEEKYNKICIKAKDITDGSKIFLDKVIMYDSSDLPTTVEGPTTITVPPPATNCRVTELGINSWIWDTPNFPSDYGNSLCKFPFEGTSVDRIEFSIVNGCRVPASSLDCMNAYIEIPGHPRLCGSPIPSAVYYVDGPVATLDFKGDGLYPGACQISVRGVPA